MCAQWKTAGRVSPFRSSCSGPAAGHFRGAHKKAEGTAGSGRTEPPGQQLGASCVGVRLIRDVGPREARRFQEESTPSASGPSVGASSTQSGSINSSRGIGS